MALLKNLLSKAAATFPDRIALREPSIESISYLDFFDRSTALAALLQQHGISPTQRVGIYLPKSIDKVISIFATLCADAVYVPVDPEAPTDRNAFIFSDCQVSGVLIQETLIDNFKNSFLGKIEIIPLPDHPALKLLLCSYATPSTVEIPNDLAYILYTSGSTGNPKGVMITHKNALSFINWCSETFDFGQAEVFSSLAPFHFDLSIFDLYVSLQQGATLVLMNQKVAKNPMQIVAYLEEYKITTVYTTPSLLKLIKQYGKIERHDLSSLQLVLFAGEVFPIESLKSLMTAWPGVTYYNLYGPTETNVVTYFKIPAKISAKQKTPFPIGKSCNHVQCQIWDQNFKPNKAGERGELLVCGASVMPAYYNLPQKTNQSFVIDKEEKKWYRTGDIVEVNEEGDFVFIGRVDRMVKRRGYRIELGEVEQALNNHPELLEAAVVAITTPEEETLIKAFAIKKENQENLKGFHLKQYCRTHLLQYMVPDKFVFLEELPKTSTHKVDYQKLKNN